MDAILSQVAQHVLDLVRFRREEGLAGDLAEGLLLAAHHRSEQVFGIQHAHDVIQVALVDRDAGVPVLGDQLHGFFDRLVHFDRDQVGAGHHDLPHKHVAHLEDAMDHLAFFFFEDALFLAHGDEHFQFFFGDERAADLSLGAHHSQNQSRDHGKQIDHWSHDERGRGDQPRHAERDLFGALQRQRLRRDLAGDEHDQRQHEADQPLGHPLLIEMQRQQRCRGRRDDDRHRVDDQDGG